MTSNTQERCVLPNGFALQCSKISEKFKEFVVQTCHSEIKRQIIVFCKMDKLEVKFLTIKILDNILKYSTDELHKLFDTHDDKFIDFCNDVVLYYTAMFVLTDGKYKIHAQKIDSNNSIKFFRK